MKKLISLIYFLSIFYSAKSQNLSLDFDGLNDYISIPSDASLDGNNAITLEAWIRLSNTNGLQAIIGKSGSYELNAYDGQLQAKISRDGQDHVLTGGIIPANSWTHVALSYQKNTKFHIYINGNLVNSSYNYNSDIVISNSSIIIGSSSSYPGNSTNLEGQIDDVKIWSAALSTAQIAIGAYSESTGTESDLEVYFKFDNNTASCDVQDCTSNENHGSRNGQIASNDLLPQYNAFTPSISDVDCGAEIPLCTTVSGLEITQVPQAQIINCSYAAQPQIFAFQATTDCASPISYSVSALEATPNQITNCPTTNFTYTYTASDNCGQSASYVQVLTIQNDPPNLICPAGSCQIDCSIDNAEIIASFDWYSDHATFTTSCNGIDPVISNNFDPNGFTAVDCNDNEFAVPHLKAYQYVTFSATDPCGRVSSCERAVLIVDNEDPIIVGEPYLTIRECDDLVQQQYDAWIYDNINNAMSASDACGGVEWSWNPLSPNQDAWTNGYAVTEVYFTATDDCGNAVTKEVHFKLKNNFPPSLSNLVDKTISCGQTIPDFDTPTVANSCGVTELTSNEVTIPGTCNGESTLTKTWTVTDGCGATATAVQNIFIVDNDSPVAPMAPENITISCAEDIPAPVDLTAVDECNGDITVSPTGQMNPGTCTNNFTMVRTWTFIDLCGNESSVSQIITVSDDDAPVTPTAPDNLVLTCSAEVPAPINLTAVDNCEGDITVSPTAVITPGDCENNFTMVRTWTFTDLCGNESSVSQTITVSDDEAPIAPTAPENLVLTCSAEVPAPISLTAVDNCEGDITVSPTAVITPGNCENDFTMVRTWTFVDHCGNESSISQTITVSDNDAPVAPTAPENLVLTCSAEVPAPINLTAVDNCEGDITVAPTAVITPGDCENDFTMVRTWTFTDLCGNESNISQTIVVNDNIAPMVPIAPEDISFGCGGNIPNPIDLTAVDNCDGDITVSPTSVMTPGSCDNSFIMVRTWTFTDICGNSSSVSQTISVGDSPPLAPAAPADMTLACANQVPAAIDLTATDECDGDITVSPTEAITPGNCENDFIMIRTWTFTDACGNSVSVNQNLVVNDNIVPSFTSAPEDIHQSCGSAPQFGTPEAVDNCGMTIITFVDTEGNCSITRTWSVADACGNTTSNGSGNISQTIYFEDDEAPEFIFIPENVENIECNAIPDFVEPLAEDNCGDVNITYVETFDGMSECEDNGYGIVRVWTATDVCGNTSTIKTLLWIEEDYREPDFIFFPEDELITCDQFPPVITVEPVAIDNCSDPVITYYTEYGTGGPDSCEDEEGFDWHIVWMATDACGNVQTKIQNFWVDPYLENDLGMVSGEIYNEAHEMIEEVMVQGTGLGAGIMDMTGDNGYYTLGLPMGNNYEIEASRDDNPMNGISTYDLILMSQHILGIQPLGSPYKMIAADINNSGTITAFDIVELRKLILLIYTEFPENPSWKFVDASYVFSEPNNPFANTYPTTYSINQLSETEIIDFVGIKMGDLNGSATVNQLQDADTRTGGEDLIINIEDQHLKVGEEYTIDFTANDFKDIRGYQFSFKLNQDIVEFKDIEIGKLNGLNIDNFGFTKINEGIVTTSWNEQKGVELADDAVIFSLIVKAKSPTRVNEILSLNKELMNAEAYDTNLDLMNVRFDFDLKNELSIDTDFDLYQNQPNPFNEETLIGFSLAENEEASLTIYDIAGRALKVIQQDFTQGYNSVTISKNDLGTGGVLYYRLETNEASKTMKMILLN